MKKTEYAIYKFDFHKAKERSIIAESEGVDGSKHVKIAQECFDSLFDQNSCNIIKVNNKGDSARLPNDVMAKSGKIFIWRVNNQQLKDVWARNGKDNTGIDKYENQEIESLPFGNVLIDNRPGCCLMAIEKSSAWSNTDKLRDILLKNFNALLADRFDLEMRIEARMNPTEIWDFLRERIHEHGDYVREVTFVMQNPKKINKTNAMEVKSPRLKGMLRTVENSDALRGLFTMEFDEKTNGKISPKNRDMAEMVRLCAENGYDIMVKLKDFKVYRINDYVKAYFPLEEDALHNFRIGLVDFNGKTELEKWFDHVAEQTEYYVNESEVPKRRNRGRKREVRR